jgi:squalene-associated FAD-dependent desaturase
LAVGVSPRVAVVGGGWAGCSAALTLAEAGVDVTLYEAGAALGGRARAVELNGLRLDNGQHILLGAYRQTLRLIDAVAPHAAASVLLRSRLRIDQPPDFRLDCPALPAPWHLLLGLMRARGLCWRDKLAAARWAQRVLNGAFVSSHSPAVDISLAQAIADQPERVRRALWEPLCVSALNTPPANASAAVFCNVLRAAFGAARAHSDLLFPRVDLGTLFPEPAAERIRQCGGRLHRQTRVRGVRNVADGIELDVQRASAVFDYLIVAVAPQHLPALCSALPELHAVVANVRAFSYLPIATAYLRYPVDVRLPQAMLALADGPAQFAFDRGQTHGQPGLIAVVASAARDLVGRDQADWIAQAERQLRRSCALPAALWRKSLLDKQATFACTPNLARPATITAHPRIFLAGDYTAGPFPATLESATASGVESAQALLQKL